jgi:hypothetical protein
MYLESIHQFVEEAKRHANSQNKNDCGKEFTQLHIALELLKLKANHGWSDNSFSELLSLLAKLFPNPNTLPISTYRAKKHICLLSLGVDKIHACLNHCILYHKEYEFNMTCLVCCVTQYKRSYNHVYADTMRSLPYAKFSYNNCYQESLKIVSFLTMDGCRCRAPLF